MLVEPELTTTCLISCFSITERVSEIDICNGIEMIGADIMSFNKILLGFLCNDTTLYSISVFETNPIISLSSLFETRTQRTEFSFITLTASAAVLFLSNMIMLPFFALSFSFNIDEMGTADIVTIPDVLKFIVIAEKKSLGKEDTLSSKEYNITIRSS